MKTFLITGATDGIGFETVKRLRYAGHNVLFHGRSEEKIARVQATLMTIPSQGSVSSFCADLTNLRDIRDLAEKILQTGTQIDGVLNNAGVLKLKNPVTAQGLDARFLVNTIAPALLTETLVPVLSTHARVVNVSSAAQAPVNISLLIGETSTRDDFQAYAQSKLALTMWSQWLATQLVPPQVSVAVNPGSLLASKMVKEGFGVSGNDLSIGAAILEAALTSTKFEHSSGKYFDNDSQQFTAPHGDSACERKVAAVVDAIHGVYR
ncbi:SDR family NAD(P)-dependent oxidoreductase [Aestuariibacter sp. A3R04]|uniref:SDR family NAD(P)-dependent oxidoreductase n=1 Tax=Aestuariibacter sp. A3R04 TaxID=2841571 RepID=UPI001C09C835|nr:SDR family NAD(P)-dependent oxidoreductase [Aestuariibacter sp. A3R04]MBU3022365.1 SDR family NAD(P)-dependent oxidoreductase [Aestuariibacter sp. A3R04]